ncbi:MAG TPA: ABC transporter ATP-binding protein [Pengzhenrongella sp.]|jgi:ABC-2 type transport system ATP-binding protein
MTIRPELVVEAVAVTRRFGETLALDDVSLEVRPGELVGLLGPNGAGKTTLLSLVTGLRKPDAGVVRLFGGDPRHHASRLRPGTTPQETGLPPTLKVGEVVDFIAGHYPDPMPRGEVLERFGIGDLAGRQTGGLSGGQKRRLAVALALAGRPRLVVLDEPTTGLDVEARHILWQALRDYHADGATVLVTSHYLEEIEALAERVVVIGSGKVLADDALAAVLARVTMRRVLLDLPGASDRQVAALPGVTALQRTGDRYRLLVSDADQLVRTLVLDGVPFAGLEVRGASLEEAFLALTSADAGAEPGGPVREPGAEPGGAAAEPGGPVREPGGPGAEPGGPVEPVAEPVAEPEVSTASEPESEPVHATATGARS